MQGKIGVFVGEGRLPRMLIERLQRLADVVVIKLEPTCYCPPDIESYNIYECKDIVELLKSEGIKQVCFCGKVSKIKFLNGNLSLYFLDRILKNIKDCSDEALINFFVRYLQENQIEVIPQHRYLQDLLADEGWLSPASVDERVMADIDYAYSKAMCVARLGIAQSVVVKYRTVVATEDIAGTDELIIRAGQLTGGGFTVCKVAYPNMLYELPMVGLSTLARLKETKAAAMALQAHKVCIIDKENFLKEAKEANIAIIGI